MAFFKKNKEEKRRKGETIIGKIIYGFLLFAPLFNILVTCMYATFNKNAYLSYSQKNVSQIVNIDSSNSNSLYIDGQHITFTFAEHNTQWNAVFSFSEISLDLNEIFDVNTTWTKFYLYKDNEDITFYDINNTTYRILANDRTFNTFSYTVDLTLSQDKTIYNYGIATVYTFITGSLDNAFIYGIQKTEDTNLFNWAKTTGTYTVIQNTCNLLGITNTFTPMLLAYWLIISIMYFIYDIALILILMVHKKIHELTDSL